MLETLKDLFATLVKTRKAAKAEKNNKYCSSLKAKN